MEKKLSTIGLNYSDEATFRAKLAWEANRTDRHSEVNTSSWEQEAPGYITLYRAQEVQLRDPHELYQNESYIAKLRIEANRRDRHSPLDTQVRIGKECDLTKLEKNPFSLGAIASERRPVRYGGK